MSKVNKRDQLLSLKQQIFHGISIFFKEFSGNSDSTSVVSHDLIPPIMARYIRFRPLAWHWQIAMRVELYGCHGNRDFCFNKTSKSNQKNIMVSFRNFRFFSKLMYRKRMYFTPPLLQLKPHMQLHGYTLSSTHQLYIDNNDFDSFDV